MDPSPAELRLEIAATREQLAATAKELRERLQDRREVARQSLYHNAYAVLAGAAGAGFVLGLVYTVRRS